MKFRMVFLLAAFASVGCPAPQAPQAQDDKADDWQGDATTQEEAKPDAKQDEAPTAKPTLNEGAKVFFKQPTDGATVTSPVKIEFGIEGAEVKPAGEDVPNSGHHHLIINGSSIQQGEVVPADETHIHYGKAQTSAEVELAPGEYTLTMQFANYLHQSYGEVGATSIKITVTE